VNVSDWVDGRAAFAPERVAIRFEGSEITYAAMAERVARLAAALDADLGVGHGDRVAFLGFNNPEMIALLFACARVGAILVPLNWRLAEPEHRRMLEDCAPSVLLAEAEFVDHVDSIKDAVPEMRCVGLGDAAAGWLAYEALGQGGGGPAPQGAYPDPLLICYTSGATGAPKGTVLTQSVLLWNAVNSTHLNDLTSADHVLTTLPLFHVGGLNMQTLPALHAGATVTLQRTFDVDAMFDAIERQHVTLTVLVPAQIMAVLEHARWPKADLSSLRLIVTGSTVVPPRLIEAVHARGVPMVPVYGATETAPIATYLAPADAERKLGSSGKAAVHCEIRLVDDDGRDVAPGEPGEILVRGPNVMSGYWNAPQATKEALVDGWFHSGDIGHQDADGFLFVDDRKKDMIISGSENVFPAELEIVLAECDRIAEAAVVGRDDERWGEVAVAVVVPKQADGISADEVSALFEGRLARFKHPRHVVFVDALPRNAMGKVVKDELRARFGAASAAAKAKA
jgi:fatty-acyl-CoA synthase